jgi:hypothetical protein
MNANVGGLDRKARWVLGAGAVLVAVVAPLPKGWRFGLLSFAATELLTAALQYCPMNQALGINTTRQNIKQAVKSAVGVAKQLAA